MTVAAAWRTALLESSLDCVILMDGEGRIVDLNRGTERSFGVSRASVVGKFLADVFVPPELRDAHQRGLARYMDTGDSTILGRRIEVQALHADGSRIMVELSIVRLKDVEPPLFVGHLRDIEEQIRRERRLRATAAASRALATHNDAAAATSGLLAAIGKELEWPFVQFWARDPSTMSLRRTASWIAADESPAVAAAVRHLEILAPGTGLPGLVWESGVARWIEDLRQERDLPRADAFVAAGLRTAVCFPVHVHGEVVAVVEAFTRSAQRADPQLLLLLEALGGQLGHFIEEYTVRAALAASEERLREMVSREQAARQTAEEASRAKDQFLAVVSHELRTPLGTILGWARMLQSNRLPPDAADKAVDAIMRNAELQARLVDDLLDMSRITSGKLSLATRPVDVPAVVATAVSAMRAAADNKALTLACDLPDLPPIAGDAGRLQQVVLNLLSNAIKFTPPGGRIDVVVTSEPGGIAIVVRDTGIGLTPEALGRLFEPFWQADDATTPRSSGLGLGLAIVRELVQAHGGHITATSPGPDRGATFRVFLPRVQSPA